ncbi:hypothetical protein C1752_09163 [Acaryochloris thomasi RCC1774]|uniref:Min27-like integrase DNA-binding domain-containing protein n=1 Tax=Acaryochloris thomasi RCC1774 TaxID=1764569 RepID=A0A2W1JNG4_9CYAN|nr:hypothetical protein C1752_09163 [Acaryochloris thomasi RCC1774]
MINDRGMLRLRWTHIGKRHSISLGLEDTRSNRAYAKSIARQIDDDICCGQFDPSKNKYRPQAIGQTGYLAQAYSASSLTIKNETWGFLFGR